MYLQLQQQLIQRVRDLLKRQYDVELPRIVVDQPPNVGLGEYALPLSFELAKKLRKAAAQDRGRDSCRAGTGARI